MYAFKHLQFRSNWFQSFCNVYFCIVAQSRNPQCHLKTYPGQSSEEDPLLYYFIGWPIFWDNYCKKIFKFVKYTCIGYFPFWCNFTINVNPFPPLAPRLQMTTPLQVYWMPGCDAQRAPPPPDREESHKSHKSLTSLLLLV